MSVCVTPEERVAREAAEVPLPQQALANPAERHERRLSHDEALDRIRARYSNAIELLGKI